VLQRWRQRRLFRRTPQAAIDRLPTRGLVHIAGRVAADAPLLRAAVSGRPCVLFELEVHEWRDGVSRALVRELSDRRIPIEDGTGMAWIATAHAACHLYRSDRLLGGHSTDAPRAFAAYARRAGLSLRDELGERRSFSWSERILMPGDPVAVVGLISAVADPGLPTLGRELPFRAEIRSARQQRLVITDQPVLG
jgi:hypothetical protein